MLARSLVYCFVGATNGFAFLLLELGHQDVWITILMYLGVAVINVAAFHAATKEKFKSMDQWMKRMESDWKDMKRQAEENRKKSEKDLSDFREEYWRDRAKMHYRHSQ